MKTEYSVSFAITRGTIAYAVFSKQRLVSWKNCSVPGSLMEAAKFISGQIRRLAEKFDTTAAVLPTSGLQTDQAAARIETAVRHTLRELCVPAFEINVQELLNSFSSSPLKHQGALRQVASSIFPQLPAASLCLDAAALGLH